MTTRQTDICDTQEAAREALENLFKLYNRPATMEADGLLVWFEPVGVKLDKMPAHEVGAPAESDIWRDLVRLTGSLARMGYFTTRGVVHCDGVTWTVACRRRSESHAAPKQSIWPWAE